MTRAGEVALAVNMAQIAEQYLDTIEKIERKTECCTFFENDGGQIVGRVEALLQAAADILGVIDKFNIHSNYIDAVQLKLEQCAPALNFQTTQDPAAVDTAIDTGDGCLQVLPIREEG